MIPCKNYYFNVSGFVNNPVEFGFIKHTLDAVNSSKDHPCYHCDEDLGRFQGKCCMMKHCTHPWIRSRYTNQLQWHDECLIYLDWNRLSVCPTCAYLLHRKKYKFQSGNKFVENSDDITDADPVSKFACN